MSWWGLIWRLGVLELVAWYLRPHWWDRLRWRNGHHHE